MNGNQEDIERISLDSVQWGRGRAGAIDSRSALVATALAALDNDPTTAVVVALPPTAPDRTSALTNTSPYRARRGEFTAKRLGPRRFAVAKREAVTP